jgi:murein DD-endopeptidase MepM/ murein hydrolase activator NlpD
VTLTVGAELENMQTPRSLPLTIVVAPQSRIQVLGARVQNPKAPWRYNYKADGRFGDRNAKHDPKTRYRLPYESGKSFKVSQGFHGAFSHTGEFEYSIDWLMPVGTTVCAARDGLVVKLADQFREGGPDPSFKGKDNFVYILHDDGTIGSYAHFKFRGISVRTGQRVAAGDVIGQSGFTGYAQSPHLHFHVQIPVDGHSFRTVPVRFDGQKKRGVELQEGETYTAP